MKNTDRHDVLSTARTLVRSVFTWFRSKIPARVSPQMAMLDDDNATPAPFNLTQPLELPPAAVDEFERPFAMADDRAKRGANERLMGKPLAILEPKPD